MYRVHICMQERALENVTIMSSYSNHLNFEQQLLVALTSSLRQKHMDYGCLHVHLDQHSYIFGDFR